MKKAGHRIWNYIQGINGIIFIVYFIFVLSTSAFVLLSWNLHFFLRNVFFITVISIIVCPKILKAISRVYIKSKINIDSNLEKNKWKLLFFLIPLFIFLIHYVAYFPGGFSPDSIEQYVQTVTNNYNDWHPVLQTLLAIKLPLTVTGGWIGSIILCQILIFSLVISYSLYSIMVYTSKKYAIISMLFILLNPQTGNIAMYPWKDVSFAIGALLLMTYSMHIFFTKGYWLKKPINTITFIVVLSVVTLFRHNAVLFTIPLSFAVLFYVSKKRAFVIIISVLILIFSIKVPLYTLINVQNPSSRQTEMLGLPMTVIGAVVANDPDALDEETKAFAYKVAPKEVWETNYSYGNYNAVKFLEQTNNDVIEEYGTQKVLTMMFSCFKNSPSQALKGLFKLTDVTYSIYDDYLYYDLPLISGNDCNIQSSGISILQGINEKYTVLCINFLPHLFMYVGAMHLILIFSILSKCKLNKRRDWKKVFFIIPVFAYNFGTMLLLTGADDSSRFFYYTFLLMPSLLAILHKKEMNAQSPIYS
jgi:hypothetical protein